MEDPLGLFKDDPFPPAGPAPPRRPRTLAADYLTEAVDALRSACSPAALYDSLILAAAPRATEESWFLLAANQALERRVRFSRNAMLFSAFAAEAYINEFITQHSAGQDLAILDRLATVEKYVFAPRLLLGRSLFPRDQEPLQSLRALFRQRDVLVHPKPEKGVPEAVRAESRVEAYAADPMYNPSRAAGFLVAVAEAATVIVREGELGNGVDPHAQTVADGREDLLRSAAHATERLPRPDDLGVSDPPGASTSTLPR